MCSQLECFIFQHDITTLSGKRTNVAKHQRAPRTRLKSCKVQEFFLHCTCKQKCKRVLDLQNMGQMSDNMCLIAYH